MKTASKTINMTFSPQPPVQTAGDNMLVANQSAASNVSMPQGKGSNTSAEPTLAASAIPYNNQLADPNLWDGLYR